MLPKATFLQLSILLLLESIAGNVLCQDKQIQTLNHIIQFDITELQTLNSSLRETNIFITPDGKHMFFMSDRGGQKWSLKNGKYNGKARFDGDLWFSVKKDETWQPPICLDSTINTEFGEDEPIISPDGQFVVFQSWKSDWKQTGGPYYIAELAGNTWSKPLGLGGGINLFFIRNFNRSKLGYATDGATLSPDGKIFIVACGEDYDGDMDLYLSKKTDGKWSDLKKMSISTDGDERSVFMAGDGKTIFFASDGYEGFGGLDVYKTILNDDGSLGEIMNVGKPFNTKRDDYGFIISASGEEAYFVRNGDIYTAITKNADAKLKPMPTLLISGTVSDSQGKFIMVNLNLIDTEKNEVLSTSKSNSNTGKYAFSVPKRTTTYQIKDKGGIHIDTTFDVANSNGYEELQIDLKTSGATGHQNILKTKTISIIGNFEFDEADLTATNKFQLDDIIAITQSVSTYSIEIIGHTDSLGTEVYNLKLGQKRAMSVKKYLMENGVDESKIIVSSFGEMCPLEDNKTEIGTFANRRTELTIHYE